MVSWGPFVSNVFSIISFMVFSLTLAGLLIAFHYAFIYLPLVHIFLAFYCLAPLCYPFPKLSLFVGRQTILPPLSLILIEHQAISEEAINETS